MCNRQGHVLTMRMNLPVKNASNRAKYGGEMSEIHSISMIFMKLIVSHSILHQIYVLWFVLKAVGLLTVICTRQNFYP